MIWIELEQVCTMYNACIMYIEQKTKGNTLSKQINACIINQGLRTENNDSAI